jgi:ribonuclease P protein component
VGVIVGKHKHNSVERNQLKRRLRDLLRTQVLPTLAPVDVVVRAAPGAYALTFEALSAEVAQLAAKLPRATAS